MADLSRRVRHALLPEPVRFRLRYARRRLRDWYAPPEREIAVVARIMRLLGGTAIDVGAHKGLYTWPLSRNAKRVIAFEPNPALATELRRSSRRNVTVVEAAISDTVGTAQLRTPMLADRADAGRATIEPGNRFFGSEPIRRIVETPVRVETLDHYVDEHRIGDVGLVKIDIEGHEESALRGAERLLAGQRPLLLVELIWHNGVNVPGVFAWLAERGYTGFLLEASGRLVAGTPEALKAHQSPALHSALAATGRPGELIVNAFFVPHERQALLAAACRTTPA